MRSCKMENVTFIEIENRDEVETHAIIDHGSDQFTSMSPSIPFIRRFGMM